MTLASKDLGIHMERLPEECKEPAWYAIYTRSRHEAKVDGYLAKQGLVSFLPQMTVPSRRRDRYRMISVPLFPGYLFVKIILNPESFHQIINIPGVVRILGFKGYYMAIPQTTIESLQTIVTSARPFYPWEYLEEGNQIRIQEGPLAGVVGTLLARKDKHRRLVVTVELFKRSVAVELNSDMVEPWS
jgi:transcription termination/antitermination protein NusG